MHKSMALLVLLAGCVTAPVGVARPDQARLSASVLTLVLTDGTICRANWTAAPVGRFAHCGQGFGYAVEVVKNPNILRQIWTGITSALGAEGAVPPMAQVVITDASGVDHVYASPVPVKD